MGGLIKMKKILMALFLVIFILGIVELVFGAAGYGKKLGSVELSNPETYF